MLTIPQNSNFKLELAKKLLLMVEEAHREFDRSQKKEDWIWDEDTTSIVLDHKKYKIKLRFGFAEYFFSLGEILKTDIKELGGVGRKRVPFGFIAHDEDSNEIYVVFRGTMTPAEWITNFQFKPGCEPFLNNNDLGKVHRGFHKIYTRKDIGRDPVSANDDLPSIKDCIEKAIEGCAEKVINEWPKKAIEKCSPDAQVYVAGHSLGGALATLATLHIKEMKYFQKAPILYAFANPRAGDLKFSKRFDKLDCFRIANSEDIVPTVPLASIDLTSGSNDTTSESLKKSLKRPELSPLSSLLPDIDYHHIGEPIYFTNHKGAIADNHIIPAYKEALGII
jgi:predicted lipase